MVASEVPSTLSSLGQRFRESLLSESPEVLRRRPRHDVWSGLEYACHVRDVTLVQRDRLYLALVEDKPSFPRMYRDERVELARYNGQDPLTVADHVAMAAELAASAFGDLEEHHWTRRLIYNWPTPQGKDVAWLAAHTVHEAQHHRGDFLAVVSGRVPGKSRT